MGLEGKGPLDPLIRLQRANEELRQSLRLLKILVIVLGLLLVLVVAYVGRP